MSTVWHDRVVFSKRILGLLVLSLLVAFGLSVAAPQQARADTPSVTIEVSLVSQQTGEPLTSEQIGSGVEVTYYAIPQSVRESVPQGPGAMDLYYRYAKTAQLTEPVNQLVVELEADPSADPVACAVLAPSDPSMSWTGSSGCVYDGTSISDAQGMALGSDGILRASIARDTANRVNATFTVTTEVDDSDAYPVYLRASLDRHMVTVNNYADYVDTNVAVVKLDGPGTYPVTFPNDVSSSASATHNMAFDFYVDEECTTVESGWHETNLASGRYYNNNSYDLNSLTVDGTGSLLLRDGNPLALTAEHLSGSVYVPITFHVDENISADQFPVYLFLGVGKDWVPEIHRNLFATTACEITGPGDYTVTMPKKLLPGSSYSLTLSFYADSQRGTYLRNWYSPTNGATTTYSNTGFSIAEDGTLQRNNAAFEFDVCCDENYRTPTMMLDVQAGDYGKYPVYLTVRLKTWHPHYGYSGDYFTYSAFVTVTEDGTYPITFNSEARAWAESELSGTTRPRATLTYEVRPSQYSYQSDDKNWTVEGPSAAYVSLEQNGVLINYGDSSATPSVVTLRGKQSEKVWNRLSGDTALDTMSRIVEEGWRPGEASTVIIATMSGYHDALAAAPLAGAYRAPILLTSKKALSQQTRDTITYLGATKAVIVGGPAAVSEQTEQQLIDLLGEGNVTRVDGQDAQETAIKIAQAAKAASPYSSSSYCIVATSKSYHDALAIAPYAYSRQVPIYLTRANGMLRDDVAAQIASSNCSRVIIVGGTAAIPLQTEQQLKDMGLTVERLAGDDAIQTSSRIATWCVYNQNMSPNNMGVATAGGYHDALAGAALCGKRGSAMILVNKAGTNLYGVEYFVAKNERLITNGYVFGGTAAVKDSVLGALEAATR